MPDAMDLGIADDGECSGHEQAAQIAIARDNVRVCTRAIMLDQVWP